MHVLLELAVQESDLGFQKLDILALVKQGSLHVLVFSLEIDHAGVGLDILVNAQCFACLVSVCTTVFNKRQ